MTGAFEASSTRPNRGSRTGEWSKEKIILEYAWKPVLAAFLVTALDSLGLLAGFATISRDTLVLLLFFEGGVGLLLGTGVSLSSTPSVSKFGEELFGTAPWSLEAEKYAERVGLRLMLASGFLVLMALLVSTL